MLVALLGCDQGWPQFADRFPGIEEHVLLAVDDVERPLQPALRLLPVLLLTGVALALLLLGQTFNKVGENEVVADGAEPVDHLDQEILNAARSVIPNIDID